MSSETTVVHVTHEAVAKVGGIGAVLHGFFTSASYLETVERSILVGPLFTTEGTVTDRLGEDGEVLYSSVDGMITPQYAPTFQRIEHLYHTPVVYGRRTFCDPETGIKSSPEVLLFDVRHINRHLLNDFKRQLYEQFGVQSHLHENLWEFEQYLRLAPPAIAAIKAIDAASPATTIISHEFMGMPTALAAIIDECEFKTAFYAHEVATMRRIVEEHPGHDTMFYNVMREAHDGRLYVNDVFGDQNGYFKHGLVEASKHCDHIYAVGDYVLDELRFLAPEFETAGINIVYNGIPSYQIDVTEKIESQTRLRQYCDNLLGYSPDYIFTHVTRLVRSKGLWRDLRVLYNIEREFRTLNKTGVMFLLSTEVSQRPTSDIYHMESLYNWPICHREGWPDLSGGEADFYTAVQEFNARSRNIKVIFINQFGFSRRHCGIRMPQDMDFMDIRKGSDIEFGQSIYEPFGIAQLEPLTFGGICVCSSVCGCAGFVRDVTGGEDVKNVIIADYTDIQNLGSLDVEDLLNIDKDTRDRIETGVAERIAMQICSRLPNSEQETAELIETGWHIAQNMSWNAVVENYLTGTLTASRCRVPAS